MEFVASYSGGKDSILSIKRMVDLGHRLIAIIVSTKKDEEISWTHSIDNSYFRDVSEALRCEVIYTDTDVEQYEERFEMALKNAKKIGVQACVFGDIDNKEHILWNKNRCKNAKIECIHPLMFEKREEIVKEFLSTGLSAKVIKIGKGIPEKCIGMDFDTHFLDIISDLDGADICGENGEYHTKVDIESIYNVFSTEVYLDNASTCFPKAPGVGTRIQDILNHGSVSISRGTFMKAYQMQSDIIDIRERIIKFFGGDTNGYQTIFGSSATFIINMVFRGILKKGDRIILDSTSHNSVYRVVEFLTNFGVEVDFFDFRDENIEERIDSLIVDNTRLVFINLVDNVFSTRAKIDKDIISTIKKRGSIVVVDAVQAVLEIDIDFKNIDADMYIFSSHIGFMSDFGCGILVGKSDCIEMIEPFLLGGTGSDSKSPKMPKTLPDRLEAGSINLSSIEALNSALDFIEFIGAENIIEKKRMLSNYLRDKIKCMKIHEKVKLIGEGSIMLINFLGVDDSMVGFNMDIDEKIMTRVGIHCSVLNHKNHNTYPNGGIRISIGYFNNKMDIDRFLKYISEMEV